MPANLLEVAISVVYRGRRADANDCPQPKPLSTDLVRHPTAPHPDATVIGMCTPADPARRRPADPTAPGSDLPNAIVQGLAELAEAARAFAADPGWLTDSRRDRLLAELRDDAICEQARLMAASDGEQLWRELLARSRPPDDVGPALLLAVSLDARCAADEAWEVLDRALRPGVYRRWALELGVDLAQDGGDPGRAWELLGLLGADRRIARYGTLQCVVHCDAGTGCGAAGLAGLVRARWLWQRARRWVGSAMADWQLGDDDRQLVLAEGGPLAELVREHGSLRGIGPMSQGLFGYLRHRWRLLPEHERELMLRWLRTRWQRYSVAEAGEYELVLLDTDRGRHRAGTEEVYANRIWRPGDMVSGWLLPTRVAAQHLLVLNTAPAAWLA